MLQNLNWVLVMSDEHGWICVVVEMENKAKKKTHVLSMIVQMLDVITSFNSNCYPVVRRK
jgi:hypothetical protein